ncbi:MAG: hypothetical protein ABI651_04900 [Verrucomicrobiota bacterium]
MKALIAIIVIVCFVYAARFLVSYYGGFKEKEAPQTQTAPSAMSGEDLPGLPLTFETSLQKAAKAGATELKNWLETYRKYVKDPRLAWIELDYVVMVSQQDPKEAKQVFQSVKQRISPATSDPGTRFVYERIKTLEKTYE